MEHLNAIQSIILGLIQGITEFLPISSSAHLIITRDVLHFPEPGKTFDIMMHFGTLVALIIYFWKDLVDVFQGFLTGLKQKRAFADPKSKLFWFLIISTIPGGLFGALFNDKLEGINNVYLISALLIIFGIILLISDQMGKKEISLEKMSLKDSVVIGIAQALALFPGVSRSGATITTGLLLGFTREEAARYSFLISVPLIGGISGYGLIKLIKSGIDAGQIGIYATGFIAAAVSGYICVKFLLDFLKKGDFKWFVLYRVFIGIALIIMGMAGMLKP